MDFTDAGSIATSVIDGTGDFLVTILPTVMIASLAVAGVFYVYRTVRGWLSRRRR